MKTGEETMFINKKVEYKACIEPDSSEEAWKHYEKYYLKSNSKFSIRSNYDFENLNYYTYYKELNRTCGEKFNGEYYNYANQKRASNGANRLYALQKFAKKITDSNNVEWWCATRRVGGDCDFNFNEKKYKLFKEIIGGDQQALQQLDRCKEMHHTLLNFSLMEATGNMQGFKGSNRFDRFDHFIYKLDQYFNGTSVDALSASSPENKGGLIAYLSNFKDIYEYCNEVYFIENTNFIDEIIKNGELPIKTCDDVVRYMNLAERFWSEKEFAFLKKEFLTVGEYFRDGGEAYTLDMLLLKIEKDLGCEPPEAKMLIEKCVERGFIIDCGNDKFTR